jgi:hypothetical protein
MPQAHSSNTKRKTSEARKQPNAHRCELEPEVLASILYWDEQGFAGTAIHAALKRRFGWSPHLNTVRRELQRHARDSREEWSLADEAFTVEEARAVLGELRHVYQLTKGSTRSFTPREAKWIARLRTVEPDLAPGVAYWRARWHVYREDQGEPAGAVWDVVEVAGDMAYALSQPVDDSDATLRRVLRTPKEVQQ